MKLPIRRRQHGLSLTELLVSVALASFVVAGLSGVVGMTTRSMSLSGQRLELLREAEFAMQRMTRAVAHSRRLILPLADNPSTDWFEHIREETVPASPPQGSSTKATAVLAVVLPAYSDLDFDGFPDADNDRDGRIDEDTGLDATADLAPGIVGIDDDGDGFVDDTLIMINNDDEDDNYTDEDPVNGVDDDGDGSIDEDMTRDMNGDGCDGICGVDDDGDGLVDEGASTDDDEDGVNDEDWLDPVVFSLSGTSLRERTPVPWDERSPTGVSGSDYIQSTLTSRVSRLRFERIAAADGGPPLIDITLELTSADNQSVSLNRRIRTGGAL